MNESVLNGGPSRDGEPEQSWWDAPDRNDEARGPTVAAVRELDAGHAAVAIRLAEVAVDDELLVVFGAERGAGKHRAMLAGLRTRLPRHDVVAVAARPDLARRLGFLLDAGSVPVVLTEVGAMRDLTAELACVVRADRVVRVFRTPGGADLYPVWKRPGLN
ncbi:hypothetical protein [Actinoplanes sp. NPDC051411]|uniref:hypothetical protein n=1 Tax=Actinoplanes sp. NPDC051411 TaxID=3155522 RepID=UPI00342F5B99